MYQIVVLEKRDHDPYPARERNWRLTGKINLQLVLCTSYELKAVGKWRELSTDPGHPGSWLLNTSVTLFK